MLLIITGGTGSLGQAIIKEQEILKKNGITKIRVISRDEQKQVALTKNYRGTIPLDCFLGDVTDLPRMRFAFRQANYAIHAAAQKHIDKFERDIPTGYRTNIAGTQHVAESFIDGGSAISGIFVSTDKAADPITAYGVSKLGAEHLWLWFNTFQKQTKFSICRYGNVFGSRGSVIETWSEMAQNGEPLKITDPSCTRFFMLIEDAAKFVLSALFHPQKDRHIPEMKAARMVDVARLIWQYHKNKPLKFEQMGMRSIEKVHELLETNGLSSEKAPRLTDHEIREMYDFWLKSSDRGRDWKHAPRQTRSR